MDLNNAGEVGKGLPEADMKKEKTEDDLEKRLAALRR